MPAVAFQSNNRFGECAKILLDLLYSDYEDGNSNRMTIVTGTGSVSVSQRLMEMMSPLVRDIVASLPPRASLEPVTIIFPDSDTTSLNKMTDLLLTGRTTTDTKESRESVLDLAGCLKVVINNLEMVKAGAGEIRVRNIQEILEPNAVMNNDKKPRTEATEKRDIVEDRHNDKKGKGRCNVNDKEMLEPNALMNNNNKLVTAVKGDDIEQVSRNDKKGEGRRGVNDKFATLPALGGMAAPDLTTSRSFNNPFCEAAASLPTFEDVSCSSRCEMLRCRPTFQNTKYIFKSGCPTPDPQWPSELQLMIGPIPSDVDYSDVRSAFHNHGPIFRLFIPYIGSEIIGGKRVKFGYIVYSDPKVVKRLLASGFVIVGGNLVSVKKMDGKPVINDWRRTGQSS